MTTNEIWYREIVMLLRDQQSKVRAQTYYANKAALEGKEKKG